MIESGDRALEGRLDALFQASAPRPAFAAELEARLRARPTLQERLRRGLAAALAPNRLAPALAALLVIAGAGFAVTHRDLHGSSGSGSGSRALSLAPNKSAPGAAAAFGRLPAPVVPPAARAYMPVTPAAPGPGPRVTGSGLPHHAPVFRYREPTRQDADRFAAALGARPRPALTQTLLGSYSGPGFTLTVSGSDAVRGLPPTYHLQGAPPPVSHPTPPNAGIGPLIDAAGVPVTDVMPLSAARSSYPLRSAGDAISALGSAASGFTSVQLAYLAVPDGGVGYLEPVYLLTGAPGAPPLVVAAVARDDLSSP
ncbi:MAG: hypothetical protein ACREPA_10595 [Candidatus Dormibacteraceae bacterium]